MSRNEILDYILEWDKSNFLELSTDHYQFRINSTEFQNKLGYTILVKKGKKWVIITTVTPYPVKYFTSVAHYLANIISAYIEYAR